METHLLLPRQEPETSKPRHESPLQNVITTTDPELVPNNSTPDPTPLQIEIPTRIGSSQSQEVIEVILDDDNDEPDVVSVSDEDEDINIIEVRPTNNRRRRLESDNFTYYNGGYSRYGQLGNLTPAAANPIASSTPPQLNTTTTHTSRSSGGPPILRSIRPRLNQRPRQRSIQGTTDIEIIDERPATRSLTPMVDSSFERLQLLFGNEEQPMTNRTRGQSRYSIEALSRLFEASDEASFQRALREGTHYTPQGLATMWWLGLNREQLMANNEVEALILARIERDNDRELDQRLQSERVYNKKAMVDKAEIAEGESVGYTNDITEGLDLACELCGVVLGDGIPKTFKPDSRYRERLEKYQSQFAVQAPYFCMNLCTETDIELSQRIFVSSNCGHIYCGRCVKEIGRDRRKKSTDVFGKLSRPCKCVSEQCNQRFKRKAPFIEVFF